jgi:hypothetical protein
MTPSQPPVFDGCEKRGAVAHELVDRKILLVLRNALVEASDPVTVTDETLLVWAAPCGRESSRSTQRHIGGDGRVPAAKPIGADHLFRDAFRQCAINEGLAASAASPRWPPGRRPAPA